MMLVRTRDMVWLIYPLLFLETVVWAFFEPGHSAVIPNITGADDVILANTLSSDHLVVLNLAIGSALGGVVAALLGRDAVFVLNALSFLGSALLIGHAVRRTARRRRVAYPCAGPGRLLADPGRHSLRAATRLLATVFVKGGLGFLGANLVILPVLGERVFPIRLHGSRSRRGRWA